LGLAAFVEGYTRIYLLKHWFTDVVGGWVYGSLLLLALPAAVGAFRRGGGPSDKSVPPNKATLRDPPWQSGQRV